MDTEKIAASARKRYNHQISNELLQEKYTNLLTVAHQGGMWNITPQLLGFLAQSPTKRVLCDIYNIPVEVDCPQFLEFASTHYDSIMNQWHDEYKKLSRQR